MPTESPAQVVSRFVAAVNAHDVVAIRALMTNDHRFVDAAGEVHAGPALVDEGWPQFLAAFPDYRIDVEDTVEDGTTIALFGRASGTFSGPAPTPPATASFAFPAAWKAVVRAARLSEWRVYADVEPMLRSMGVKRP